MKLDELKGRKILILGYGREGQATEAYLRAKLPGAHISHADAQDGSGYLERQKEYDIAIKTPGIPKELVTIPYTTATNLFFGNCGNTVVGVTGTKGKSTTASLIHHILISSGKSSRLVGNIGNPALLEIMNGVSPDDIFVMELSSYQLDDIRYSPHISVVTNLFPEHMNYHKDVTRYYNAKRNIIRFVKHDDYFIYNPAYPLLADWAKNMACRLLPFAGDFLIPETKLVGQHNRDNIRAAATACRLFAIPDEAIQQAVSDFRPLEHRLEKVGTFRGITFYDDAISTTPQSTAAALKALGRVDTVFFGGEDRGYDFLPLVATVRSAGVRNAVFFPDSGPTILNVLEEGSIRLSNILHTRDMKQAVRFAYEHTKPGGVCLLSTASPSYSVWKNFEEKGTLYKSYIRTHEKDTAGA